MNASPPPLLKVRFIEGECLIRCPVSNALTVIGGRLIVDPWMIDVKKLFSLFKNKKGPLSKGNHGDEAALSIFQ